MLRAGPCSAGCRRSWRGRGPRRSGARPDHRPDRELPGGTLSLKVCVPAWKPSVTLTLSPNGSANAVLDGPGTIFTTYHPQRSGFANGTVDAPGGDPFAG